MKAPVFRVTIPVQPRPIAFARSATTTHDDPTSYTPPDTFGPFRVLHQIGVGVLGPVFRTYEAEHDRLVAVKVLRLDLPPEQLRSLIDELRRLADLRLSHQSLVKLIGAGIEGTTAYVAEEYVAAESLDVAMRHYAPAPLETVLPFLTQLAGAIDYAWGAGVGHGALHPRDIFLTPEQARATGFGMAKALEGVGLRPTVRRPYSAPERIAGGVWGTEADVYALAAIAYELLTAKRMTGTGEQLLASAAAESNVPSPVRDVLGTALASDPSRRYPSALVLLSALKASLTAGGAVSVPNVEPVIDTLQAPGPDAGDVLAGVAIARAGAEPPDAEVPHDIMRVDAAPAAATDVALPIEPSLLDDLDEDAGDSSDRMAAGPFEKPTGDAAPSPSAVESKPADPEPAEPKPAEPEPADPAPPAEADRADAAPSVAPSDADALEARQRDDVAVTAADVRAEMRRRASEQPPVEVLDGAAELDDLEADDLDEDLDADDLHADDLDAREPEDALGAGAFQPPVPDVVEPATRELAADDTNEGDPGDDARDAVRLAADDLDDDDLDDGDLDDDADDMKDEDDDIRLFGTDDEDTPDDELSAPEPVREWTGGSPAPRPREASFESMLQVEAERSEDERDDEEPDEDGRDPDDLGPYFDEAPARPSPWPPAIARAAESRWSSTVLGSGVVVALVIGFIAGYLWRSPATPIVTPVATDQAPAAVDAPRAASPSIDSAPPASSSPTESAPQTVARSAGPDEADAERAVAAAAPEPLRPLDRTPGSSAGSSPPAPEAAPTSSRSGAPAAEPRASNGPVSAASNRDGRLLIRTTPAGAEVTLDGRSVGTSPIVVRELEYGAYTVRVSLGGFETLTRRLAVTRERPSSAVTLALERATPTPPASQPRTAATGALYVDSRPRGAAVSVDGQVLGTTPLQLPGVAAGTHEVRLELEGYRSWTSSIQVRADQRNRVTGSLEPQRP